ncbi:MAG: ribonuclease H-like domain-containing protein [Candidatus Eiseniibacteriota bacterium]
MSASFAEGLRALASHRATRGAFVAPVRFRAPGPAERYEGETCLRVQRPADDDLAAQLEDALARLAGRAEEDVDRGLRAAAGCRLAEIAFLDLETTGFWGCPIFLVGLLLVENERLVVLQLVARDYPEEAAILRESAELLAGRRTLVTFNGRSYDVPCFRERAVVHGVSERLAELRHVDILHPLRRRFRDELPDCRLITLEREVVGVFRGSDVPSREIPALYHEFAGTGDTARLAPLLHHSRLDLMTTARLFAELASA